MEKPEQALRDALEAFVNSRLGALAALGVDPATDDLCVAGRAALAQCPGLSPDTRVVCRSLQDFHTCMRELLDVVIQGVREDNMGRIGNAISGIERATARLQFIGKGPPGEFNVDKWDMELKAQQEANEASVGKTMG